MQSIAGLLTAAGVNLTGWWLRSAFDVSADGSVIVGRGTNPFGQEEGWIARFTPAGAGLLTFSNVYQSFSGQSVVAQTGSSYIAGSLGALTEYATQARQTENMRRSPYSVFGYAAYDSDPSQSGMLGISYDLPDEKVMGVSISAGFLGNSLFSGGSSRMLSGSVSAFVAQTPRDGIHWLLGFSGATMSGNIKRGYLNGSGQTFSEGNTSALGYGFVARAGWSFSQIIQNTQMTPFVSYTSSVAHVNGYSEMNGPFPARFDAFNDKAHTGRVGADARYNFSSDRWVWGRVAQARRLNGSYSDDIGGALVGLFSLAATAVPVAKDWIETAAGVRLPLVDHGALTISLTASIPRNYTTTYLARLGLTQSF